ncbi:MAG: ABC transporter ATP-binding protein [Gemmatimonadota bacterium]
MLAAGLACVIVSGALGSINPTLLRRGIDGMRPGASMGHVWRVAALMLGVSLAGGIFRYGMRELLNALSRRIEYDLRNDLLQHLLTLDAPYFGRTRTGELMARLTNDLSAVRMAAGPAIMYLVNTAVGGLFALGFMLSIEPRLTLLALVPMLPLPWLTGALGRRIHTRFEDVQEHFGAMTTRVQENLAGTRIVRAYRQEGAEEARWGAMSEEYLESNLRLARLQALMHPTFALLGGAGSLIVLGVGGSMVMRGTITVGAFVAFGMYLTMLVWPLIALGWVTNLFQRASASMERLEQVLDAQPLVTSPAAPRTLPPAAGGRSLEFRDVGFAYPPPAPLPVAAAPAAARGRLVRLTRGAPSSAAAVAAPPTPPETRWVFRHVSFTVAAGETLGVVGATGSGKSALLDLITRTWDPTEGEILMDGVPIRELSLDDLRRELGVVPQESVLFSDTIQSNLTYGTTDDAPVGWAADVAQLTETIQHFPGGFQTILGERGINLSGGQKQRAALARALARRPSIVLLDDALSAVDTHTEAAILHGLRDVLAGRTAIIASHRVSAIRDADHIIVLDNGGIVEAGQHDTLFAGRGRYWSLLARQQLEEEVEEGVGGA